MGRRKISMDRKIEKKSNLQVTFTKRRQGMLKKAAQLSLRCGADIAILVRSPAGKIFAFGSPSADAVIRRFEGESSTSGQIVEHVEGRTEKDEQGSEGQPSWQIVEHKEGNTEKEENLEKRDQIWWNKPFESMGLDEFQQFSLDLRSQSRIPV